MRIGANQRIALLLLATGPAPSTGELCAEIERQGNCGRDVAPKSVQRLMRGGLVRRLPGRGAPGSWGALALTASGRRYLAHRRVWWERKDGAPERPAEWGLPRPLLAPSLPARDEEPGPDSDPEPAAAGRLAESPEARGARGAAVGYARCPACGAPAGALAAVPPPPGDPGYRAVRCARCRGEFAR